MSKINLIIESLKTTNYLIAAAAVAGTVMMPIPPVRAADAGMQTAAVSLPKSKPIQMKTSAHAPLDLAAVARMAPPEIVAQAEQLAMHDTIGILTKQQIIEYAKSNPGFVAKLQHAYLTGTLPQLTAEEARIVQAFSDAALGNMKAGDTVTPPVAVTPPVIGGISGPTGSPVGIAPNVFTTPSSDDRTGREILTIFGILALVVFAAMVVAFACGPNVLVGSACANLREMFGLPVNPVSSSLPSSGIRPIANPPRAF